ncbi:MAG: DUF1810 domain-containing protein [Burkholderiales bacterium]|nr:DUF1810 domain-containing protein [Burkholderiales bacterium]
MRQQGADPQGWLRLLHRLRVYGGVRLRVGAADCVFERFIDAQAPVFDQVMVELRAGRKTTHWMWFIFPQLASLGRSATARYYGLASVAEARAYLAHPVLGERLIECTRTVCAHSDTTLHAIFGSPDDLKFRSCMTLFGLAKPEATIFPEALSHFCEGRPDPLTVAAVDRNE